MALRSCRGMQGKHLVFLALLSVLVVFFMYIHFEGEIARLDAAKRKLEHALARLQLDNIDRLRGQKVVDLSPDELMNDLVIIYNRVPKTGSTSFMGLTYDLCLQNKFNVLHINITKNMHVLSLSDQVRFVQNVTGWDSKKPAIYHGHMAFLDFSKYGMVQKPVYINIIRKPIERLISYYYFLRYGDDFRPHIVRRRQGDKMTFDDCVEQQGEDCAPENMWLQIPFFCGHLAECWIPGNSWALQQAKNNLMNHYLLVGVTEELQDFITLLEFSLPRLFNGAAKLFASGNKSHLRKTANKKEPSAESIAKIQASTIWKMENEFYEFVLELFHFVKKRTLTIKNGELVDKGQNFMYEKVRPK